MTPGPSRGSTLAPPAPVAARGGIVALAVLAATLAAAALEAWVGVADASPVYLVPVVVAAALLGTWAAVAASFAGFLAYDFLFTLPRFTLVVADPAEWLSLLLFLIVAVVVGRLTALLRDRADEADRRAREGVALVAMSRDVAMTASFEEAAAAIAGRLLGDAEMASVWVTRAVDGRWVASAGAAVPERPPVPWTLMRSADDGASDWLRLHGEDATDAAGTGAGSVSGSGGVALDHYVVAIRTADGEAGRIHALRAAGEPRPGRGARRLLALAADQLGVAVRRDELRAEVTAAEVARQSDALRAAILDSVSHDLRTPIASIRALAGGLADPDTDAGPAAARSAAGAIDAEATRLAGLVGGLLDMGRIQAGAVRPDLRPYDVAELVETTLRGHPPGAGADGPTLDVPDDLPPVLADAVLFDAALGNVLDNAALHTPPHTSIRVRAAKAGSGWLEIAVEDDGPGVPPDALPHLFDRFYRVRTPQEPARRGLGMGLAIARGFVEAMGGSVTAGTGPLGGLAVVMRLPAAPEADA